MTEEDRPRYYCNAHKPPTPSGWLNVPNLYRDKNCYCGLMADRELAPKPLTYPKMNFA